jgi:Tfp pilus assembly protein PilV
MKHDNQRLAGLSLVEVAIAVLVLGIILVPLFSVFERSSSGTVQTRAEMLATNYADELLAWLQTLPMDHAALAGPGTPTPLNPPPEFAGPMEPKFQRFLTVKDFPATTAWPFRYKVLTVLVSWTAGGPARETRLAALKYEFHRP